MNSPVAPPLQAAIRRDPLELASELSDLLDVLQQCRARNLPLSDEFLAYLDTLLDEVDMMEIFGRIHAA